MNKSTQLYLWLEDLFGRRLTTKEKAFIVAGLLMVVTLLLVATLSIIGMRNGAARKREEAKQNAVTSQYNKATVKLPDWVTSDVEMSAEKYERVAENPDIDTVANYARAYLQMVDESSRKVFIGLVPFADKSAQAPFTTPISEPSYYAVKKKPRLTSQGKTFGQAQEEYMFNYDVEWIGKDGQSRMVTETIFVTMLSGKVVNFRSVISPYEKEDSYERDDDWNDTEEDDTDDDTDTEE